MTTSEWYIELTPAWIITPHPAGTGLALEVMRGIPCEGHAQLFTCHENTAEDLEKGAEAFCEKHKPAIVRAIDGFVVAIRAMRDMGIGDDAREAFAAVFCQALINRVTEGARLEAFAWGQTPEREREL